VSRSQASLWSQGRRSRPVAARAGRYALSAFGPLAVSAAHFIAALVFLHTLSRDAFGVFAFVLVVVPFFLSASTALLGAPLATLAAQSAAQTRAMVGTHLKANLVFTAGATIAVFVLMVALHAPRMLSLVLGAYGGAMVLRWFARSLAYARHAPLRPILSDALYGSALIAGLGSLVALHAMNPVHAAYALLCAACLALAAFGRSFFVAQFRPGVAGPLADYASVWKQLTRWSLLGVVLTEITANAQAYLVTFVSGPAAFALLAVGALLMRPATLACGALPDRERPAIARALAAGNVPHALRIVKDFRTALGAVWAAATLLAVGIVARYPQLVLKPGYDRAQVAIVLALFSAIVALRALRTPSSVLLQAAGEFRALADAGLWSSVLSVCASLALLLAFGPVFSLAGILAGEALMAARIQEHTRRWVHDHG
jgi:putative peptidoglycan lipid II flippase